LLISKFVAADSAVSSALVGALSVVALSVGAKVVASGSGIVIIRSGSFKKRRPLQWIIMRHH
jgi:hypothetical protein